MALIYEIKGSSQVLLGEWEDLDEALEHAESLVPDHTGATPVGTGLSIKFTSAGEDRSVRVDFPLT